MKSHRDFVSQLPSSWLECRDLRHSWVADQSVYRTSNGLTIRVLDCHRCGATKYQLIRGSKVVSTSMKFPAGYVKDKNTKSGRIKRDHVVRESLVRMKEGKSVPDDVVAFMERRGLTTN